MRFYVDINEDEEMREYIKGLIQDQVMSVARSFYEDTVKKELERKLKNFLNTDSFRRSVNNMLYRLLATEFMPGSEAREQLIQTGTEMLVNQVQSSSFYVDATEIAKSAVERLVQTLKDELIEKALQNDKRVNNG